MVRNWTNIVGIALKHLRIRYPEINCKVKKAFVFEALLSPPKPGKTIGLNTSFLREAILYHVFKKSFYPYIVYAPQQTALKNVWTSAFDFSFAIKGLKGLNL